MYSSPLKSYLLLLHLFSFFTPFCALLGFFPVITILFILSSPFRAHLLLLALHSHFSYDTHDLCFYLFFIAGLVLSVIPTTSVLS